jgi:hypothetical protein
MQTAFFTPKRKAMGSLRKAASKAICIVLEDKLWLMSTLGIDELIGVISLKLRAC